MVVRVLGVVILICDPERGGWPSFHNRRLIWLSGKQSLSVLVSLDCSEPVLLSLRVVGGAVTLAIESERVVSLNPCLTRLLKIFIQGHLLKWDLLAGHACHEEGVIWGVASTDLGLDSARLGVVAARVLHILLKASDAHGLTYRRLGVLVPTYLGPKTFKMSRGLLVKVRCILIIAKDWLSTKSRRVCRVEAEIPVRQGVSLRIDLLQVVRARVSVERVPLISFQLVVEVSWSDTLLAVVLLGS